MQNISKVAIIFFLFITVIFSNLIFSDISLDDSYITFRYSKNLADGNGITWNIGEKPVEGYTNFFWMILNAAAINLNFHPMLFSKIFSFLITVLLVLVVFFYTKYFINSLLLRFFAAFIISISPIISFYSQSGMETLFFVFLTTLAIISYINWIYLKQYKYLLYVSFLCGLASLTRPEGFGVFIIIFTYQCYDLVKFSNNNKKLIFSYLIIPFLIIFAPYFIWRLNYFGYVFPNTYYAKHTGAKLGEYYNGLLYLSSSIMHYFSISAITIVITLFTLHSSKRTADNDLKARQTLILILFFFISFALYVLYVGGDDISAFPSYRLMMPIIPITIIGMSLSLSDIFLKIKKTNKMLLILFFIILIITIQFSDFNRLLRFTFNDLDNQTTPKELITKLFSVNVNDIVKEDPISSWLENRVTPNDYIAIPWAGKVSYYTRCKIVDMLGLNDTYLAHLPKKQRGIDVKMDAEYIINKKPKYIFINVNKEYALGIISFEKAGGWKLGDKELLDKLKFSYNYKLIPHAPFDITIYELRNAY